MSALVLWLKINGWLFVLVALLVVRKWAAAELRRARKMKPGVGVWLTVVEPKPGKADAERTEGGA